MVHTCSEPHVALFLCVDSQISESTDGIKQRVESLFLVLLFQDIILELGRTLTPGVTDKLSLKQGMRTGLEPAQGPETGWKGNAGG